MPYYPNPAGGSMYAANESAVRAQGWTPSMGSFGTYSQTESGPPPSTGGTATATPGPSSTGTGANLQAAQLLLNNAQQAAYQAYLNSKLSLDTDQLAFQKATQAFQNEINKAAVTGMYQGQPTFPAMQAWSQIFGTYGMPTQ